MGEGAGCDLAGGSAVLVGVLAAMLAAAAVAVGDAGTKVARTWAAAAT